MNPNEFSDAWLTLTPTADQRRRINTRVYAWLDARETSLAREWLGLLRLQPFAAVTFTAVSGVAILASTPLLWFLRVLL